MSPRASILVPTHSHASTLALSVGSALRQTEHDVEVLIIGDGVTEEVRAVATALVAADTRVRFFDHSKGANHGETYRDAAIREASSDAIFYLCDDDILMRDHVADLLELLRSHNFVQSRNGYFGADGSVIPIPGDLASEEIIALCLSEAIRFNCVSLTGTAHSRAFYLACDSPWTTTPVDEWPDHFQWKKMMRHGDFRGATSHRMTALQFPSSSDGRDAWTADQRHTEIAGWAKIADSAGGQRRVDAVVAIGDWRTLVGNVSTVLGMQLIIERRSSVMARRIADALPRPHRTRKSAN